MAVAVMPTLDDERDDLEECLGSLVAQAKVEARRGYAGVQGARYAELHANINLILDAWRDSTLVSRGTE